MIACCFCHVLQSDLTLSLEKLEPLFSIAQNFQPPNNPHLSEKPFAHATNSYPHHSNSPLKAKQYSKLTNTPTNAEYYVPKNSPSIKHSCLSTRCPSKSKIRNILNLRCPKCPSHSNRQNGHSPNICLYFQATHSYHQSASQLTKRNLRPFLTNQ